MELVSASRGGDSLVAVSDKNGLVFFRGVQPGPHSLKVAHAAGGWADAALNVKINGPRGVIVPIQWPSVAPVHVRALNGVIRGPGYLPGRPQPGLALDLVQGISGQVQQTLQTGGNGEFNFESAAPGLVFCASQVGSLGALGRTDYGIHLRVAVDPRCRH